MTQLWPMPAASLDGGDRKREEKEKLFRRFISFFFYQLDKSEFTSSIAPDIQIIHDHLQCAEPPKNVALIWPCRSHKNRRASLSLSLCSPGLFFLFFFKSVPAETKAARNLYHVSAVSSSNRQESLFGTVGFVSCWPRIVSSRLTAL